MGLFSFVGGLIGGGSAKKAATKAADLQYKAAQQGIKESARQFDLTRADYAPYQEAGKGALGALTDLIGLGEPDAQQSAITALRESPLYKSLFSSGEEALLANASATGGLRGGNTQRSLADFGEDTLSKVILNQIGNYGNLVGVGSGATGAVGAFGANAVSQQNDLRNQGAQAQAQAALTRGGINAQNWQNAGSLLDSITSFLF